MVVAGQRHTNGRRVMESYKVTNTQFEKNTWYWIQFKSRDDDGRWWPIYINDELEYKIDSIYYSVSKLVHYNTQKAVTPL